MLDAAVKSAATHLVAKWQKVQERAYSSNATPSSAATAPKRKADSTDGELSAPSLSSSPMCRSLTRLGVVGEKFRPRRSRRRPRFRLQRLPAPSRRRQSLPRFRKPRYRASKRFRPPLRLFRLSWPPSRKFRKRPQRRPPNRPVLTAVPPRQHQQPRRSPSRSGRRRCTGLKTMRICARFARSRRASCRPSRPRPRCAPGLPFFPFLTAYLTFPVATSRAGNWRRAAPPHGGAGRSDARNAPPRRRGRRVGTRTGLVRASR